MSSRYLASYVPAAGGAITGTLAASESGADTAAIAGAVRVAGALAASESGADTASIAGSVGSGTITGALAASESDADTAALAGVVRILGALASSESGSDTASIDGTVETPGGTGATAAEIWGYVLPNGMTAGATLSALHTLMSELHLIHGLTAGSPMSVSSAQRRAGAVTQSIADNGVGLVTVTRQ